MIGGAVLTAEFIVAVVAAVIALALDVVPGLKAKWEPLPCEVKRFTWLVGCFLVGLLPYVAYCVLGVRLWVVVVCGAEGLLDVLGVCFAAYFASQSVHGLYNLVDRGLRSPRRVEGLPEKEAD